MTIDNLQGREWLSAHEIAEMRGVGLRQAQKLLARLNQQSGGRLLRPSPNDPRQLLASVVVLRELLEATTARRAKEEVEDTTSEIELLARVEAMETKLEALREVIVEIGARMPQVLPRPTANSDAPPYRGRDA